MPKKPDQATSAADEPAAAATATPEAESTTEPAPIGLAFVGEPSSFIPGWPNESHNEPDAILAARKVASGRYTTTDPLPALPEPPEPEPEPEPPPPAPRPAFWWEEVSPESVAKARAVLEAAAQQAAARTAASGDAEAPPEDAGAGAGATAAPAVSAEQVAQARAVLEQAAQQQHAPAPTPPESDAGG